MLLLRFLCIIGLQVVLVDPAWSNDGPAQPIYTPLRPPSIPLAVRSPYTSAWSTTVNGSTLNSRNATFWNGDPLGWSGMIRVDDVTQEYLGDSPSITGLRKATPRSVSYDSHYSNFTFAAGPVLLTAQFFSPVLPPDLCRSSIPLSYVKVSFESVDDQSHYVQLYSDVDDTWLAQGSQPFQWKFTQAHPCAAFGCPISKWTAEVVGPTPWEGRWRDPPYWGRFRFSTDNGTSTQQQSSSKHVIRLRQYFADHGSLAGDYNETNSVHSFLHIFGHAPSGFALYTVGTTQDPAVNYVTKHGTMVSSLNGRPSRAMAT
ncbi:hypothetical protein NX059_011054 [Plenodomus lindquistii]|nr:hypothetical protein NX059_011054 [Plenodomus lindquistii]